jgi:heme/copper-type cytochrome/quinol oxidase subunit 4
MRKEKVLDSRQALFFGAIGILLILVSWAFMLQDSDTRMNAIGVLFNVIGIGLVVLNSVGYILEIEIID